MPTMTDKLAALRAIFEQMGSVLVAFSGGIDSTLVFKVAHDTLGARAIGVTAVSPTFPAVELDGTRRLATEIGGRHLIVQTDQLERPAFVQNDASRCYHCKADLYQLLGDLRLTLEVAEVADGTNLDDLGDDRPGISAARQWKVRSPLVEAGLTKPEIRAVARHLGLTNWDKPAAACLSSRIPRGIVITREKLSRVERAEAVLAQEGFRHFRVRAHEELARIELGESDWMLVWDSLRRRRLTEQLKALGFRLVTLDLEGYRTGGGNG